MAHERDILQQAARMSVPWPGITSEPASPAPAESIAPFLTGNNVSFMTIQHYRPDAAEALEPFARLVAEEKAHYRALRDEFERVRIAMENEGIQTLFIKASGLVPSFPHLSSNLDVLVRSDRGDDARRLLHRLGYIELVNVEEPGKFLFRRFAGGFNYTFHLHETVGWGVPFVDPALVWEHRRAANDDPAVHIPGPRESLLITLAHWFYEDKRLTLANLYHTANALSALPGTIEDAAAVAASRGWEAGFYGALKIFNESWKRLFGSDRLEPRDLSTVDAFLRGRRFLGGFVLPKVRYGEGCPARIPFAANKVVYYGKIAADPSRPAGAKAGDMIKTLLWAVRWKLHIRSQRPLLVAMSGCDGSGKTLQAERLSAVLSTCDLRHTELWARSGSSAFVSFFTRMAKRLRRDGSQDSRAGAAAESEKVHYRRAALRNPLARFLYASLCALDLWWIYAVRTRAHLAAGSIVVCDRYVADAVVDFHVSAGSAGRRVPLGLRILEFCSPRPDLSFLLDVHERDALARKPEEGSEVHLKAARERFLEYARGRGMLIVDAGATIDDAHALISNTCLGAFYGRYRTALNALLASNPSQINPGRWRP